MNIEHNEYNGGINKIQNKWIQRNSEDNIIKLLLKIRKLWNEGTFPFQEVLPSFHPNDLFLYGEKKQY